jgi:hypothetical protein
MVFASGCGGSSADSTTWLIVAAGDTVTVGDVGEAWNSLKENQRELFLSKDNVIGEYIVTYGHKILLQHELDEAGYITDDRLVSASHSWYTEKCGEAARRLLYSQTLENVTDEEVEFFVSHLGLSVLFTEDPGTDHERGYGPIQLPTLPVEMVMLIDTLEIGETGITETGIEIRLDTVLTADSLLLAQALADSAGIRENALNSIASANFEKMEDDLKLSLLNDYDLSIDSTAFEQLRLFYAGESEFPDPETVILSSDIGNMTADYLKDEIYYYDSRFNIDATNSTWLYEFLKFSYSNLYAVKQIESESPETSDSLLAESEKYLLDIASEEFYSDRIQSRVNVTPEDMHELFENMEEPFTIPEKRVLQAITIHSDSLGVYRQLDTEARDEFLLQMPGFPNLAADPSMPQITKPLTVSEIPGYHGDEVFLIDPSDTTSWLGPLELFGGDQYCMFRLIEVIPERNATYDEVEDQLELMTINRLEEQATVEVIMELEEKYGMLINEEILEKLPEDISEWATL